MRDICIGDIVELKVNKFKVVDFVPIGNSGKSEIILEHDESWFDVGDLNVLESAKEKPL